MYVSTWKTCVNCYPGFYQEFFNFCIFNIGLHCTVPANIHDQKCIVTMLNLNGKPFYCKCYCATLIFNHLDIKYPEIIHLSEIPWCFLYMYIKILCVGQQEILSLFNIGWEFRPLPMYKTHIHQPVCCRLRWDTQWMYCLMPKVSD